jgi:hypothetical protein
MQGSKTSQIFFKNKQKQLSAVTHSLSKLIAHTARREYFSRNLKKKTINMVHVRATKLILNIFI